jgi:outer membrane protein assembly factor BamA
LRRFVLTILLTLVFSLPVFGQRTVSSLKYIGEKPRGLTGLYNIPGRQFEPDSLSSDSLKIVGYYQNRGWYDCSVSLQTIEKNDGVEIKYEITRGNIYRLAFDFYNPSFADTLQANVFYLISFYENKPATSANLGRLSDDIIRYFSENGFPYCDVRYTDPKFENSDLLRLTVDMQPGPEVKIERVVFAGLKNLDAGFLQGYTGIVPPSVFSSNQLNNAQKRLNRAAFIRDAGNYELRYQNFPERGIIIFPITEVPPLVLDGSAGYSSRDNEFYGRFNITISNILGKGRQARFEWAKKDKPSRKLRFVFTEPYPFGIPFDAEFEFYQDDRDSLFIDNGGSVGLRYLASDIYSYGVAFGLSTLNPESYGRTILPHKNKLKLSASFSADTRDSQLNPRTGDYLYLNANFISETVDGDSLFPASNTNYRTAELRWEKLIPVTMSSTLFGGLWAKGDFSNNLTPDRLSPLGGLGSLRGYMQDQFFVSRLTVGTFEYRLLTSRQGRAYIFSDGAVFQIPGPSGDDAKTEYRSGFGVGLTAAVKIGLATVEIAVPDDEGFSNAKLHFGIKTGF